MPAPFSSRHIGPSPAETTAMLAELGCVSLDALIDRIVPESIRDRAPLDLDEAKSEEHALATLRKRMSANQVLRSFIGMGYHDTFTPPVIQRNIFENPGWYTAYTPYQAEISQGRLEALLNYQTMICDLTALDVANASMLDEGTAAAEACAMALANKPGSNLIIVSDKVHPHVFDVILTRMEPLGVTVKRALVAESAKDSETRACDAMTASERSSEVLATSATSSPVAESAKDSAVRTLTELLASSATSEVAAVVAAYPDSLGIVRDLSGTADEVHQSGALFIVCADLLALTLIKPPGEFGADICVGNSQRFGVPLGFGGPHAAFMAVKDALKRRLPGRLIGISQDATGKPGYRLSLQTREQHIRREKATSNICTAQVLLAVMASMYAVYHGPEGLKAIARRVHSAARWLAKELKSAGFKLASDDFFDTLVAEVKSADAFLKAAMDYKFNLRRIDDMHIGIALDERVTGEELVLLLEAFGIQPPKTAPQLSNLQSGVSDSSFAIRHSSFLTHPVFNSYHSETEMMRYLHRLEAKDIALNRSMIPLGSCTMKLNAAAEMMPLTWPEVGGLHPFAPSSQSIGYQIFFAELEKWLATCTGFAAVSLQPNAGSQGEYAGLLAIHRYHQSRGEGHRNVCLIPTSAHGTNPASAAMCGMKVVAVACDDQGNISLDSLRAKLAEHAGNVSCLMVTYPSTHGVFEETIAEICALVHQHGGQVYMDGANMNAQVGLTSPGKIGADVCHLNLHKTFCIPHGGGGPGVGPIGVALHLKPFLPGHFTLENKSGAVCSAPWGSASICTISWMYIAMMGRQLTDATKFAILNANYVAKKLAPCFPTLYKGRSGLVAHECILDFRHFKKVTVEDVAKRLMDFGYHAPTMSWPVAGTLMIEPTESESKAELDRFCEAMTCIFKEIEQVESGALPADDNPLKHAPHTAEVVTADDWKRPYSRQTAAYPLPWVRKDKYWPPVSRIDNVHGDRHLVCTCPSVEEAAAAS